VVLEAAIQEALAVVHLQQSQQHQQNCVKVVLTCSRAPGATARLA
jgi:hypothetical protein